MIEDERLNPLNSFGIHALTISYDVDIFSDHGQSKGGILEGEQERQIQVYAFCDPAFKLQRL